MAKKGCDKYLWDDQEENVYVITNDEQCENAINKLKSACKECNVLGVSFQKNFEEDELERTSTIDLLQLASIHGTVFLFRLQQLGHFPDDLKAIIENDAIIKVCPGSRFYRLLDHFSLYYNVNASNMLKLQSVGYNVGVENGRFNMNRLCSKYLGVTFEKSWLIESRNWDALELPETHIYFATNEVRSCIELFKYFTQKLEIFDSPYAHINSSTFQDIIKLDQENYHKYQVVENIKPRRIYDDFRNVDKPHILDKLNVSLDKFGVIGFDCEWDIISRYTQIAKLQLVSTNNNAIFIQLNPKINPPSELTQILESDHLLKVCISPEDAIEKLSQLWKIEAKNFLDIRFLAEKYSYQPDSLVRMLRNVTDQSNSTLQINEIKCHAEAAIKLFHILFATLLSIDTPSTVQQITKAYSANLNTNYEEKEDRLTIQTENLFEITDGKSCTKIMKKVKEHCMEYNILGIDCEWNKAKKLALLQLATHRGLCVLIRLSRMKKLPNELKEILQDERIIKVGKCVGGDASKLSKQFNIGVPRVLDIGKLAKICGFRNGGLGSMSEAFLNAQSYKDNKVSRSNWEKAKLSDKQRIYAAKDALAGIELFKFFTEKIEMNLTFDKETEYIDHIVNEYFSNLLFTMEYKTK